MKIPSKLKVGANTFRVMRSPLNEGSSDHCGGWMDWESNTIFLGTDMPEDREATCFLHEILHALNVYLSEKETTYLSEALMQIIRDNKLNFHETK